MRRLVPLQLHPLAYADARLFLAGLDPLEQFERFSVTRGMPRYLSVLGRAPTTRAAVCREVLDRNSALWDEGRTLLEAGLRPVDLFDSEVAPELHDHTAAEFEDFCRRWTREQHGTVATRVGSWWGPALDAPRRTGGRQTEEIDIVGISRNRVTLIGEARWRTAPMGIDLLDAIDPYKLPALRQSGLKVAADPQILLFSCGGYTSALVAAAAADDRLTLVDVAGALSAP